jgi:MinD-like ATPase involved in chromosome partitioning or flagellar assembly
MPKVIAIHSFRGGTGKSNLTANLAATIALQGRRVGIIDTDIQSPGIHVLFGLDEEKVDRALNDYLWGKCSIEDVAYDMSARLRKALPDDKAKTSAIYLIPSSIRAGEIARVLREGYDVELLSEGFQTLGNALNLDYLFIDTHPGLNEETLLSITLADTLMVILRPDRQDYQGTAVTIEVARKLDVPEMLITINKVLASVDREALRQEVEDAYKAPVAAILPLTEDVVQLASSDIFCLHLPEHPWTREVRGLAERIMAEDSGG